MPLNRIGNVPLILLTLRVAMIVSSPCRMILRPSG